MSSLSPTLNRIRLVLIAALTAGLIFPPHAMAAVDTKLATVPVYTNAGGHVTVLKKTITLRANQKAYLFHTPIYVKVDSWGTGSPANVGQTTTIKCSDVNGRQVARGHWAANIRVADTRMSPQVRIMLDQTTGGTYDCVLTSAAYSTRAASGMKVGVYAATADVPQIGLRVFNDAATWTGDAANAPGYSIAPGKTLSYMPRVVNIPHTATSWTVIADAQISSCNTPQHYVPVCSNASTSIKSSSLRTWIQILPLADDGRTVCAKPVLSAARSVYIDDNRHHQTINNSIILQADKLSSTTLFPRTCTKARVTLQAQVTAGDYAIAHDEYHYARVLSLVRP